MEHDKSNIEARLRFAVAAARDAGQHTLKYFQRPGLKVDLKSDASPVTIADREAEQMLRAKIESEFSQDAILGEEFEEKPGSSGYRWILDPIDGTKSFISGVPLYGTLVGVEHGGRGIVGVAYFPALHECIYAGLGLGAWYEHDGPPQPARVSSRDRLADCLFCTSEVASFTRRGSAEAFERLQAAARLTRTWGDCYGYMLVATGRAELMVDPMMSVWDAAALQPILEEAGGTFTDWRGTPTIHNKEGIATNGRILDEVLAITRG